MNAAVIYLGASVVIVFLVAGGGITLALAFHRLSIIIAAESGSIFTPATGVAAPPTEPMELALWKREQETNTKARMRRITAYRNGVMVLLWLSLLTAVEFVANLLGAGTASMFVIAIIKAAIIAQYFMHISSLWLEGGSH
jgi:hypothetical protein